LAALILLPTLPPYILARYRPFVTSRYPALKRALDTIVNLLEILSELNLAIFYLRGRYYDIVRRMLGVSHVSHVRCYTSSVLILKQISSIPENPHTRPPSYSVLGMLILIRLAYRFFTSIRALRSSSGQGVKRPIENVSGAEELRIDGRAVADILDAIETDSSTAEASEYDQFTVLEIPKMSSQVRAGRVCTLCLEERRGTCVTECGHLFDWDCIYGWGREKVRFTKKAGRNIS
jgi:peroxin-10